MEEKSKEKKRFQQVKDKDIFDRIKACPKKSRMNSQQKKAHEKVPIYIYIAGEMDRNCII